MTGCCTEKDRGTLRLDQVTWRITLRHENTLYNLEPLLPKYLAEYSSSSKYLTQHLLLPKYMAEYSSPSKYLTQHLLFPKYLAEYSTSSKYLTQHLLLPKYLEEYSLSSKYLAKPASSVA